jgi:hypothetical protein
MRVQSGDGTATVTWSFTSFKAASGPNDVTIVTDSTIRDTIVAQVTQVNGRTDLFSSTPSAVQLTGGGTDVTHALTYSLSTYTAVTSLTIQFTLTSSPASIDVDTVYANYITPEPSSVALFAAGLLLLGAAARARSRKRRRAEAPARAQRGPRMPRRRA